MKDISKIPKNELDNIFLRLEDLSINGLWKSQIKRLNNYKLCDYRLRVWDYRILFNLNTEKQQIIIFRVLHRSKLY